MKKSNEVLNNAVVGSLPVAEVSASDAMVAIIAEQLPELAKSAEMLITIDRQLDDVESGKSGIASIIRDVLLSQGVLTFAWHEVVRLNWGDVYRARKGLPTGKEGDNATNVAWHRVQKYTVDMFPECAKPKAETNDAEKKAAQRAKQAELLAAYEDVPVADLKAQVKSLYNQAGDGNKEAKKEANKLEKVLTAKVNAETNAVKEEVKALKDSIKELLKKVDDVAVLDEVDGLLRDAVDQLDI